VLQPSPLESFITRLERLGIAYMVTGSAAGIVYGEPRMTRPRNGSACSKAPDGWPRYCWRLAGGTMLFMRRYSTIWP
jgi:hypothetical protein